MIAAAVEIETDVLFRMIDDNNVVEVGIAVEAGTAVEEVRLEVAIEDATDIGTVIGTGIDGGKEVIAGEVPLAMIPGDEKAPAHLVICGFNLIVPTARLFRLSHQREIIW